MMEEEGVLIVYVEARGAQVGLDRYILKITLWYFYSGVANGTMSKSYDWLEYTIGRLKQAVQGLFELMSSFIHQTCRRSINSTCTNITIELSIF